MVLTTRVCDISQQFLFGENVEKKVRNEKEILS